MPTNENYVLVTRPSHQATHLCSLLTAHGFQPIRFPTIDIQAVSDTSIAKGVLLHSHQYDYLIFVSANAVSLADTLLKKKWPLQQANIVAIGPKTADLLTKIGIKPSIISAAPFSSENLLEQLPSTLEQKKGLIIKGEGGRALLSEQLQQRGMKVDCIDVYKRALPSKSNDINIEQLQYITITSQLALDNLFSLLPKQTLELKKRATFVAFSQRIAHYAESLGCQHILTSQEASDMGVVSTIVHSTKR
ncbi:MAG: uroporphyrinogen-III synthase [Cycloclasticus sp.]|nr:uroporphyrinogen-III synthase [Cycloclasticus sp.]